MILCASFLANKGGGQSLSVLRPQSTFYFFQRIAVMILFFGVVSAHGGYVSFVWKQSGPVRLSADRTRLVTVNTPDAWLSLFDVILTSYPRLLAEMPVGIEPVFVNPRNNDEVWVVNEVS